jgi:hypothetical protein
MAEEGAPAAPPQLLSTETPAFAPVVDDRPLNPASTATTNLATPDKAEANPSSFVSLTRPGSPPGWLQQPQATPFPIAVAASNEPAIAPIRLAIPQEDQRVSGNLARSPVAPSLRSGSLFPIPAAASPPGRGDQSERGQTDSEQQQGTFALDTVQLGRWMVDHLERQASRPGTMTTGIDPRMTTLFPGAPTGA